jgi:nickel/cobalt transporter (NicO) family protein
MTLLLLGAATVGILHSLLPDHWVPLAVVARTQRWSLFRLARVSTLAASGHVLASIALGAVVALVGLQFQRQIETQQGHLVGAVLIVTGAAFLVWGMTGHGHAHPHGDEPEDSHRHVHAPADAMSRGGSHAHEHAHGEVRHSHRHHHDAFVQEQASRIAERTGEDAWLRRLSVVAVPFGAAASPDLTFLPFAFAATTYGRGAVASVLVVFAAATMLTFVGLTVIATAAGYQMQGEWLEKNANTVTSLVLIGIGVLVFAGI